MKVISFIPMNYLHFITLALVAITVLFFLLHYKKLKKHIIWLEKSLDTQRQQSSEFETKFNHLKNYIPYGEQILLEQFRQLISLPVFDGCTIYGSLNFPSKEKGSYKQIDFLLVSPKFIAIIESKYWKGTTFLFTEESRNPLSKTDFKNFGVASNRKIAIYNAQENNNSNQLILSKYTHPIAQARDYSGELSSLFNIKSISNLIIFETNSFCKAIINGEELRYCCVDQFTSVCINDDENILRFFKALNNSSQEDCDKVHEYIKENNLSYRYMLNSNDFNDFNEGDFAPLERKVS